MTEPSAKPWTLVRKRGEDEWFVTCTVHNQRIRYSTGFADRERAEVAAEVIYQSLVGPAS